jgi:AcrR family transcriptional regulator
MRTGLGEFHHATAMTARNGGSKAGAKSQAAKATRGARVAGTSARGRVDRQENRASNSTRKAVSTASTAKPSRRAGSSTDDPGARRKLIEAAIQTILEQGFYRASSNAIAETAGLSWGVIQYYFGSRENLMLAVLEEGTHRLIADLAKADLTGATLTERFEQYFRILEGYYGTPDYLAFIQVLLNLSHDPRTSEQARRTMIEASHAVDADVKRLTNRLLAGTGIRRTSLRNFPFQVLRGLALSEVMVRSLPYESTKMVNEVVYQRHYLAKALTLLIESEVANSTPSDDA